MPPQPLLPNPPDYPIQPLYLSTPKQPKHPLPTNLPDYLDQPQTPSSAHNIYLPILTNLQTKPPYATMTTPSPLPICVPHRPKPHIPKQPFSTHHNCSCQPPATDIITTPPYPGSRPYQPLPPWNIPTSSLIPTIESNLHIQVNKYKTMLMLLQQIFIPYEAK